MEGSVVAGFFEQLDGEKSDGHVFGSERDDAFGVGCGFGSIAELETGFDESAEDLRAFGGFRIFLKIDFEIADDSGAIVAGGFDSLLEFVGGGEMFGGGLGGGFFGYGWSLGEERRGEKHEENGGTRWAHEGILYEGRGSFNTEGTEGGARRSQRRESESRTGVGLSDEKVARREARVERSFNTEGTEGGAQRSQRRESESRTGAGLSDEKAARREARVERSFNTEGTEGGAQRSQRRENGSRTGVGLSNDRVAKSYRVGCGVSVLPSGSSGASSRGRLAKRARYIVPLPQNRWAFSQDRSKRGLSAPSPGVPKAHAPLGSPRGKRKCRATPVEMTEKEETVRVGDCAKHFRG